MRIEMWADVICPFCGLFQHRLTKALERYPDAEFVHRSFQLDPSTPVGRTGTTKEYLFKKFGMTPEQVEANNGRLEEAAAADGLTPFHVVENTVGNTLLAHRLLAYATDEGVGRQAWGRLFTAYWSEQRPVFDVEDLVKLAPELGLDPDKAREVLESDRYTDTVRADIRAAAQLGVNGVPFTVIDGKYGISGAQPMEVLENALTEIAKAAD
jgi:predicted DsbA family dithiol-disulfide isomerase